MGAYSGPSPPDAGDVTGISLESRGTSPGRRAYFRDEPSLAACQVKSPHRILVISPGFGDDCSPSRRGTWTRQERSGPFMTGRRNAMTSVSGAASTEVTA